MVRVTLDTGALIALERGRNRLLRIVEYAIASGDKVVVPGAVVVEWWRGARPGVRNVLRAIEIEPLDEQLARSAGEALAMCSPGPSVVDAVVMASAARSGGVVYTADYEDFARLSSAFPSVRVLAV